MERSIRGRQEYQGLMGPTPEQSQATLRLRSPQMYETLIEGAFGGALANAELSRAHREIATVAMLASMGGAEPQLAAHTRAALLQGVTPSELLALAEHVSVYSGFPRALNALNAIDQVLTEENFPKPAQLRRATLRDHETVVAQKGGSVPAVILLHAIGLDWRMWEPVMDQLAIGRRVFAYDIRGHGWAAGAPNQATMADNAEDLIAILDELGLEKAHIVGLSYGGAIAQTAAIAHPERIESLALLATTDQSALDTLESRARSGEIDGMQAQIAPTLSRWFTSGALAENGWGVRYARERILRANPADWAAAWRTLKTLDVQGKLSTFSAPTLVVGGELDISSTPEIMTALAKRIPGSIYEELPKTTHMQTLESPQLVVETLDKFLPTEK